MRSCQIVKIYNLCCCPGSRKSTVRLSRIKKKRREKKMKTKSWEDEKEVNRLV